MPLAHFSKVFGVKEVRLAQLLTDPAGGAATYGATVAVPGAKEVAITGVVNTKYLRGDNSLLDADAVFEHMEATFSFGKQNLDLYALMTDAAVVDAGVTPNQSSTWTFLRTTNLKYFQIDCRSVSADFIQGDVRFTLYKCKIMALPTMGLAEEDYRHAQLNVAVMPRIADNQWISEIFRETAAALP